ncbi:hypothetical protein [Nonomuraea sp. NPDC050783]|uniref:hypothetical protein n=1 Tax=Nonomuraea sp. NPDC050783 TaxID=3154634 RepID=UPI0034660EA1
MRGAVEGVLAARPDVLAVVGRCLLDGRAPDALQAVAFDAAPGECLTLGGELAASGARVGLLARTSPYGVGYFAALWA